jgi:ABC-type phosphate/phosphonate transport system substrate-binding protein
MSTPLPTIPPTVEPGSAENPVRVVLVSAASGRAADSAVDDLQSAVQADAGLTLDVATTETDREAVQALCAAFDGPQAIAFVSGLGYSAASALDCGEPAFLARGADGATTREIIMIASEESEVAVLSDLQDKSFCRLSESDLDTWLAPSLLMLSAGLPPTAALREVVDLADFDALVAGVISGDCDVAALPRAEFERIADSDAQEAITVLPQSVELPLGVVMVAPEMPLGVRTALTEALDAWADTADGADALDTLISASELAPFNQGALDDWDALIARTGLDFASFQY